MRNSTALAAAAAALALALAGCGGSGHASVAGCRAAMTVMLDRSEAGIPGAKDAPEPKECHGLTAAQLHQIAAQVVQAGLQKALRQAATTGP